MCYVLCDMCYVLFAMCYVLCAMCYVLCAMCYVLFAMCYAQQSSDAGACPLCGIFSIEELYPRYKIFSVTFQRSCVMLNVLSKIRTSNYSFSDAANNSFKSASSCVNSISHGPLDSMGVMGGGNSYPKPDILFSINSIKV